MAELSPGAVGAGRAEHQAAINSMMLERMSTDISALKKQYSRIKLKQQQQAGLLYIHTGSRIKYRIENHFFSVEDEFRKWQRGCEMLVSILWHFSQDLQWKLKLLNLINPVNSRTNTLVLIFMCQLWLHYTVDIWCSRSVLIGVGSAGVKCNELQFVILVMAELINQGVFYIIFSFQGIGIMV